SQMAAVEALESPESEAAVERMVARFRVRRDLVVEGLNSMPGVRCQVPEGAFYAFPNIEGTGLDERRLADELLTEAGGAPLPGTAFGPAGAGFLRLAYQQGGADLPAGLGRVGEHPAPRGGGVGCWRSGAAGWGRWRRY